MARRLMSEPGPVAGQLVAGSVVPFALVILAAAIPSARAVVLVILVAGAILTIHRNHRLRWVWVAPIPVAITLCWGLLAAPMADAFGADCTDLGSPPAVWRAGEAALALAGLAVVAHALRARPFDLGLRRPGRRTMQVGIVGAVVLGPIGLLLGAALARPFFGTFALDLSQPGFILPALVFALANGVTEELAYRGALLAWTARVTGIRVALVGQAVVFGLAHGGADVGGSPIVLMAALGVGGLLAGVIATRTRSLWIPIAWHVALDLPLYVYLACRAQ